MKLNAIMIASLMLMTMTGYTQTPSTSLIQNQEQCKKYKSLYFDYMKNDAFIDARNFWLRAYKECGGTTYLNEGFFINGIYIYKKLATITFVNDSLNKKQALDSIPWMYEQQLTLAPNPLTELKFAHFLLHQKDTNYTRITTLFNAVDTLKSKIPALYYPLYFRHQLLNIYNNASGLEKMKLKESLFKTYFKLENYINITIEEIQISKTFETKDQHQKQTELIKEYEKAKQKLERYLLKIPVNPQTIEKIMTEQFLHLPTDSIKRYNKLNDHIHLIEEIKGQKTEIYSNYIYEFVKLKPSVAGYMGIGNIEENQNQLAKAINAYQKALALAKTFRQSSIQAEQEQNEANLKLATLYYKSKAYKQAYKYAKNVSGQKKGIAYIICGNSIAALANSCGESTFDRKANYWLANDYYQKAANLGEDINRNQFSNQWPTANECFNNGKNKGDKLILPCWNENTIIR